MPYPNGWNRKIGCIFCREMVATILRLQTVKTVYEFSSWPYPMIKIMGYSLPFFVVTLPQLKSWAIVCLFSSWPYPMIKIMGYSLPCVIVFDRGGLLPLMNSAWWTNCILINALRYDKFIEVLRSCLFDVINQPLTSMRLKQATQDGESRASPASAGG